MAKRSTGSTLKFLHYYPSLVAVIAVKAGDRTNLMAAGWHLALSFAPPLYGVAISPKRHTYDLVKEAGEFTVNFLPGHAFEKISQVGGTSGRDLDKFAHFGITTEPPVQIQSPILADAYASYECKLVDLRPYGDHDLAVGEIVQWHTDPTMFLPNGQFDVKQQGLPFYRGALEYMVVKGEQTEHVVCDRSTWNLPEAKQ